MLFGAGGLVGVVLFALWIWALIDCISTDSQLCRNLPKGMWLIIVIILFDLGAILWLILGRPANKRLRPPVSEHHSSVPNRPRGLEDRAGFGSAPDTGLDISDRRSAELDARLAAWEAERDQDRTAERDTPPDRSSDT